MARTDTTKAFVSATGAADASGGASDLLGELVSELVSRAQPAGGDPGTQLAAQLEQLRTVSQAQVDTVSENTRAVAQNTIAQVTTGDSTLRKAASGFLGNLLGVSPLLSVVAGLFGSGEPAPLPALVTYTRPPAIQFEGSVSRTAPAAGAATPGPAEARGSGPAITIQVQAMDSQSFLDHSQEIAMAVRQAMLNSHSLNDVVNDL